jgi:hypothetical protein
MGEAPQGAAPAGPPAPSGTSEPDGAGQAHPRSDPDGPSSIPVPPSRREPTADGQIHARTQTEQVNEELQEENAETSMDQPSDGSGSE